MVISSEKPQLNNNKGLSKLSTLVKKNFYQVLGNIVQTHIINKNYVGEDGKISLILMAEAFAILSEEKRLKHYGTSQLIFGRDIIIPINIRCIRNKYASEGKRK